jgi:hypothetical protein
MRIGPTSSQGHARSVKAVRCPVRFVQQSSVDHRHVNLRPGEASDLDLARCAYLDCIDLAAIPSMKFCKFE